MRSEFWILDDAGEPVSTDDVLVWAQWFEKARKTRANVIAQDKDERKGDEPEVLVSTVFLGVDHNFFGVGPPILWETMILGGPLDGYQRRYSSRAAALEGHAEACDLQRRQRRIPKAQFNLRLESVSDRETPRACYDVPCSQLLARQRQPRAARRSVSGR